VTRSVFYDHEVHIGVVTTLKNDAVDR